MKSVLLHVQNDGDLDAKLQAALAIVRASNGHLSCLHVTPINAYVAFDGFGGPFVMSGVLDALQENEDKMRASIEEQGKMTPRLAAAIGAADSKARLEDLYLPFKPKRRTRARCWPSTRTRTVWSGSLSNSTTEASVPTV